MIIYYVLYPDVEKLVTPIVNCYGITISPEYYVFVDLVAHVLVFIPGSKVVTILNPRPN